MLGYRNTDPETSAAAAARVCVFAGAHYARILHALKSKGPQGKDGISAASGLDKHAVARRLTEMHRAGMVYLTGKTVPSSSGRAEREWKAA